MPIQEKSELIEQLIKSLVLPKRRDVAIAPPDPEIDELWKKEAESRIDTYDEGKLTSVTVQEAISNIIN